MRRAHSELLEAQLACAAVRTLGLSVAPATLRSWKHRGRLQPRGRNGRHDLFDLDEVYDLAKRHCAAVLDPDKSACNIQSRTALPSA